MNLFDRIAASLGYVKTQTITAPPTWLVADGASEQFNIPDRHLPEAQLELYQRLSWVQIAVHQVAAMAATSAFGVLQLQGEKKRKVENHPFELLLRRPNPLMSRFELVYSTMADYDLTGNAYWWLNRANEGAAPDEIWALPCHKVKPVPDGNMFLKGYVVEIDEGKPIPLELHEVVHFKRYHPLNPFVGLSPIESLAITATADMNMQKFGANYFDKGFAKPQGALAFSDPIPADQWKTLKDDVEREHGGTKRKLMMLRGVGAGGVQWVQMALSQKDMEFLESRTFNKEEIFAMYAPGLASMLSVNATEANSLAGKKTFIELGVWPHLVAQHEKITNDVLPAYGQNLVGEFDDIRITDRAMQLSEQAAYAAVHTIDEVRERFYEAEPIGDDRGKLLIAEIGKGMTDASEPPTKEEQMEMQRQQLEAQQANQQAQPGAEEKPQTEGQPESDEPDEDIREEEAKRFKKWLKKRPNADVTKFDSDILSDADLVAIAAQIKTQEGGADQGFFTGKATRRLPGADGNDTERSELEDYHAGKLHAVLRKVLRAVAPAGTTVENITPDLAVARYQQNHKLIRDAIIELLMDGAQLGADTGIAQAETILGVRKQVSITGVNWDLVNEDVLQWVLGSTGGGFGTGYGNGLAASIAQTSENQIRANVAEWINNGLPFNVLLDNLERSTFSRRRADMIATTEITRAYAEGNRTAWQRSNVIQRMSWQTSADERVCPVCGPLQGKEAEVGGDFNGVFPPAHPRCRCWITPVATLPEQVTALPELGEFATLDQAQQWAQQAHPNIQWDFEGAHVDTINPTLTQFDKLAKRYPDVAKRLEYVGTYKGTNAPNAGFDSESIFAHASYYDGKRIGLNPQWYGNPDKLREAVRHNFDSGWLDADGSIESVMTHEFGHMAEGWLLSQNRAFIPYIESSDFGIVNATVRQFNNKYSPTSKLSEYATTTNKKREGMPPVWADDKVEGWAEAFSAIHHKPRKEWPAYVKKVDTVLEVVGDTSGWISVDDATWKYDLRGKPELMEKANQVINEAKRKLGL